LSFIKVVRSILFKIIKLNEKLYKNDAIELAGKKKKFNLAKPVFRSLTDDIYISTDRRFSD